MVELSKGLPFSQSSETGRGETSERKNDNHHEENCKLDGTHEHSLMWPDFLLKCIKFDMFRECLYRHLPDHHYRLSTHKAKGCWPF